MLLQHHIRNRGITAIEMMVTIIIVSVLAAIAFPSYQDLMQNYRARTLSTEFSSTLAYVRSEAIKRGQTVTICSTGNNNFTTCGAAADWQNGWIVFVDPNSDGIIANNADRLKIKEALGAGTTFNTAQSRVSFNSRGFLASGASTFNLSAPNCTGNHGRQFNISNTGRIAITQVSC